MDGLLDAQIQNALLSARASDGPSRTRGQTPEEIRATAEEFESVFLAQVMEHMMGETTQSSFGGGPGEAAFSSMLNEEYAKVMAKAGGIGLADALAREMLALQEGRDA
jgi:flagellar protein FlgJ